MCTCTNRECVLHTCTTLCVSNRREYIKDYLEQTIDQLIFCIRIQIQGDRINLQRATKSTSHKNKQTKRSVSLGQEKQILFINQQFCSDARRELFFQKLRCHKFTKPRRVCDGFERTGIQSVVCFARSDATRAVIGRNFAALENVIVCCRNGCHRENRERVSKIFFKSLLILSCEIERQDLKAVTSFVCCWRLFKCRREIMKLFQAHVQETQVLWKVSQKGKGLYKCCYGLKL